MKLWEALKIVDEGGKVKRKSWNEHLYMCKNDEGRYVRIYEFNNTTIYTDVLGDINNNDWELYE